MCMVSAVSGNFGQRIGEQYPWLPLPAQQIPNLYGAGAKTALFESASKQEVEKLRQDIEELKRVLAQAKEYDDKTGQPDCESLDKLALIRALAKELDIDLNI